MQQTRKQLYSPFAFWQPFAPLLQTEAQRELGIDVPCNRNTVNF